MRTPTLGAFTPGCGIKNDDGVFQLRFLEGFGLFFKLPVRNVLQ